MQHTELITVPTFTFYQGDLTDSEQAGTAERPISVDFYNGNITLRQNGDRGRDDEILISPTHFEALVKAIRKMQAAADDIRRIREKRAKLKP